LRKTRYYRAKKALSPLVTTAILITAGILGGLLLYQYFNNVMGSLSPADTVTLSVTAQKIGDSVNIYYTIRNLGTTSVVLVNIKLLDIDGNELATISLGNQTLASGSYLRDKWVGTNITGMPEYAVLVYNAGGKILETPAAKVLWQ